MGSGPPGPPLAFHGPNSHKERSHMARTPLLSRFQELFEDFDEADRSGRSVESVQEERRQMRFTRRDIPKAGRAAAAAPPLSFPCWAPSAGVKPRGTHGRTP